MSDANVRKRSMIAALKSSVAPPETAAGLPTLRAAYSDRTAWLMASLAQLAYNYPTDGYRGPSSDVPQDLAAYGFVRITYFHNILAIEDHGIGHYVDKLSHTVAARPQSRSHKPTRVLAGRHGSEAIATVIAGGTR